MAKVKLGDVAREHKETCKGSKDGLPIVGLEHLIPKEVTLTLWDEEKENTFTKVFRKGQVLFGRRRAYLKKAAIAPFDGICSGDITVIEAIPGMILPELLPFIIQNDNLFDFAIGKSAGSLSPRVKWEHLQNYEFDLPCFDEQKRLVEVLWAAEEEKQAIQSAIEATENMLKSLVVNEGGLPIKLGDLVELCYGKSQKQVVSDDGDYPIYGTGGLMGYATEFLYDKESILIGRKGTIDNPIYLSTPFWVVDTTYYVKPISSFSMKWLYSYLKYAVDFKRLNEATGVPSLNANVVKAIELQLPSEERQHYIEEVAQKTQETIGTLIQKRNTIISVAKKILLNKEVHAINVQ